MEIPNEQQEHKAGADTEKWHGDVRLSLNAEQQAFVAAWEESHGRAMTDQEIRLSLEQMRAIGELE